MTTSLKKDKTISTRVTADIDRRAKENLAKQGLTISEYIRLSLVKAANDEVQLINFLDTPAAHQAKKEAETDQTKMIGNQADFEDWLNKLNEN
ncbi:hypothetical protein IV38_GL001647 [Lactobacillus selangorensis]|uniref:RelB n=1 Tax=Lactobacillus selangorensis TaxID=81857 RepID=A0A0R2FHT5_9LACO|nr:type II toxin-antitoxin system RelB/DinJ family antitoxin [Lactobacillus selangorensis]KRN28194.1 hypothetical protein IV38_GL001647 [Lactobacillus selangorensis]KRN30930.1 hypothetical protein IV40_GL001568 [Lactobacillus selangorensis]